jgi:hypothetical protein
LELGIEFVVLVDHLVVFEDLLCEHFLGLLNGGSGTAGYFFYILRFSSFWMVLPWY